MFWTLLISSLLCWVSWANADAVISEEFGKIAKYRVLDEGETLSSVAESYYGFSAFKRIIYEYNKQIFRPDTTEELTKGDILDLPPIATCFLYMPLSCLEYGYSKKNPLYGSKRGLRLVYSPWTKSVKQGNLRRAKDDNSRLLPITEADLEIFNAFAGTVTSLVGAGSSVFSSTRDTTEQILPYFTLIIENHSTEPLIYKGLGDWRRVRRETVDRKLSCNFTFEVKPGDTNYIHCTTRYMRPIHIEMFFTHRNENVTVRAQTLLKHQYKSPAPSPSYQNNIHLYRWNLITMENYTGGVSSQTYEYENGLGNSLFTYMISDGTCAVARIRLTDQLVTPP